jgi:hypothetical protein
MSNSDDDATDVVYATRVPSEDEIQALDKISLAQAKANNAINPLELQGKGLKLSWEPLMNSSNKVQLLPVIRDANDAIVNHPCQKKPGDPISIAMAYGPCTFWQLKFDELKDPNSGMLTSNATAVVGFDLVGENAKIGALIREWTREELAVRIAKWTTKGEDGARYSSSVNEVLDTITNPNNNQIFDFVKESTNEKYPDSIKLRRRCFPSAPKSAKAGREDTAWRKTFSAEEAAEVDRVITQSNNSLQFMPLEVTMGDGSVADVNKLRNGAYAMPLFTVYGFNTSNPRGGATLARSLRHVFVAFNGPESSSGVKSLNILDSLAASSATPAKRPAEPEPEDDLEIEQEKPGPISVADFAKHRKKKKREHRNEA